MLTTEVVAKPSVQKIGGKELHFLSPKTPKATDLAEMNQKMGKLQAWYACICTLDVV